MSPIEKPTVGTNFAYKRGGSVGTVRSRTKFSLATKFGLVLILRHTAFRSG
jgi:hypothetical protein